MIGKRQILSSPSMQPRSWLANGRFSLGQSQARFPMTTIIFDMSLTYICVAFGGVLLNNLVVEAVPLPARWVRLEFIGTQIGMPSF